MLYQSPKYPPTSLPILYPFISLPTYSHAFPAQHPSPPLTLPILSDMVSIHCTHTFSLHKWYHVKICTFTDKHPSHLLALGQGHTQPAGSQQAPASRYCIQCLLVQSPVTQQGTHPRLLLPTTQQKLQEKAWCVLQDTGPCSKALQAHCPPESC